MKIRILAFIVEFILSVIEWLFLYFLCYSAGSHLLPFIFHNNYSLEYIKYDRKLIENKAEFKRKSRFSYKYDGINYYHWEFVVLIGLAFWIIVAVIVSGIYQMVTG